jgi:NADH-quinone oxidoreductase subunit L
MKIEALGDLGRVHPPVLLAGAVPIVLLVGFVILAAWGRRMKGGGWLAVGLSGSVAAVGAWAFVSVWGEDTEFLPYRFYFDWFRVGDRTLSPGIWLDKESAIMLALVTGVSFLVHIFSLAYIAKDPLRHRYWAYLSLFSAAMCGLVLADNLLSLFVFWELVGLASWLLIGFWFRKPVPAFASQKAFIVNRIADAAFIVALMLLWNANQGFSWTLFDADRSWEMPWTIGLCLLIAALGKSAQFPFQVWLPDAMAGPTPVSSLIHAATMVAAGVYLLIRAYHIFPADLKLIMALVGGFTALIAAISALTQTDIKRVLAYSTVSQLGLMMVGIGVSYHQFALAHLAAHGFFKCGLFLVAGAVIHNLHQAQENAGLHFDAQDMRFMGGLRKRMPLTFVTWLFFAASLCGLPLFSGFLTKDGIIVGSLIYADHGPAWYWVVPVVTLLTSLLTPFYIARQGMLVFGGKNRAQGAGASAGFIDLIPRTDFRMILPLVVLAIGSTWLLFYPSTPFHISQIRFQGHWNPLLPWGLAGMTLVSILAAIFVYRNGPIPSRANALLFNLSFRHFFFDRIYQGLIVKPFLTFSGWMAALDRYVVDGLVHVVAGFVLRKGDKESISLSWALGWWDKYVVDGLVNGVANSVLRSGKRIARLQSGKLQLYIIYTLLALLLFLLALIYIFTG